MLFAPATTVLLLARLFNFIADTTLSAGSDLKTILILFDKPSARLANEILSSFRQQSIYVSCFTINVDEDLQLYKDIKHGHTLTLAIFENDPNTKLLYCLKNVGIVWYMNKNSNTLVYPFELTDNDNFLSEFIAMPDRLNIILVSFVKNNIKVICRSKLYNRTISLNELQFQNNIQNLFYRPFDNLQSQSIDIIVAPEPPTSFNTISTKVISGFSEQSQKQIGVAGVDLYLTQLITECLNGKALFHAPTCCTVDYGDEMNDFLRNKLYMPLKSPDLPAIKYVDRSLESELTR